jgi:hypothetical protein
LSLQYHDDGGGSAHCAHCGALAVGPCARCELPLCADCCVVTEGGTKPYAICQGCAAGGSSLTAGWLRVLGWVLLPIVGLLALLLVLALIFG